MKRRIREAREKTRNFDTALMLQSGRTADIALIWNDTQIKPYSYTEKCIKEAITRVSGLKY
ncbi:MAG: hypothetical protein R2758_01870 [Bacteroidales bacterium]